MPILSNHEGLYLTSSLPICDTYFKHFMADFIWYRGFIIIDHEIVMSDNFIHTNIGKYHIYIHNTLEVQSFSNDEIDIIILGKAYFVDEDNFSFEIINNLAAKLTESEERFFELLDYIGGRYVIFYRYQDDFKILNDPHAFKTVFYHKTSGCCASHLELLNLFVNETKNDFGCFDKKQYKFTAQFPGNLTCYDNIFFLPGNFTWNVSTRETKRFWPRAPRKFGGGIFNARTRILKKYYLQILHLSSKYKLASSLTSGKDSNVTLFSMNNLMSDVYFFTESRDHDIEGARNLAYKYGLKFFAVDSKDIHLQNNFLYHQFNKLLDLMIFPVSAKDTLQMSFIWFNIFGSNKFVNIHSNGAETGRDVATYYRDPALKFSYDNFKNEYIFTATKWLNQETRNKYMQLMDKDDSLNQVLKDYYLTSGISQMTELGYNGWNLLYMEHRMAAYLSVSQMVNDFTFDSLSLSNTRDIINDFWSIDDKYINVSSIIYNAILDELRIYNYKTYYTDFSETSINILIQNIESDDEKDILYAYKYLLKVFMSSKLYDKIIDAYAVLAKYDIDIKEILPKLIRYFISEDRCEHIISLLSTALTGNQQLLDNEVLNLLIEYIDKKQLPCQEVNHILGCLSNNLPLEYFRLLARHSTKMHN